MTLEEFMKHAADAAYMGDADLLEGHAREVFGERDAAHQEVKRLRDRVNELESPLSYLPPSEERAKAVAAIERAKSEEYRALYLAAVQALESKEGSGGSMQSEFAAAIAALDGMKRERDEARKALDEEKAESRRLREVERELAARGLTVGKPAHDG